MNEKSFLIQLRPRCSSRWRDLPILGPLLDDFLRFLHDAGYAVSTISNLLGFCATVVYWFRRRRITTLCQLTQHDLQIAGDHFRRKQKNSRWVIRPLTRFLNDRHLILPGANPVPNATEVEVTSFKAYLRETRGLAEATIQGHVVQLRAFLQFLRVDQDPGRLQRLQIVQVEAFLCRAARTNNRFSLQHIVATLRAYRAFHIDVRRPRRRG